MNFYCDENSWIANNFNYYTYYYNNFPLEQNGLTLPLSFEYLKSFYIEDMNSRNLEPMQKWENCYEALFSYLLSRLDGSVTFEGRTWIERTIENIPKAFGQTFESITNPFGIPLSMWFFGGIILLITLKK